MDYRHEPVLLQQVIEYLDIKQNGTYVDSTVGGAGHSAAIYERLGKGGTLMGLDLDSEAIDAAQQRLSRQNSQARLILVKGNFACIQGKCRQHGLEGLDGFVLDAGVSSHQLDNAERGFSYMKDAPLDMRMDTSQDISAWDVVNSYGRQNLADVIRRYGEERWASRIAKFIADYREKSRINTTGELVDIIKAAIPASARRKGPHPAKRTFQAIRIEVNRELENLEKALDDAASMMKRGGRMCIITFHSLEDRLVKKKFVALSTKCICPPRQPICTCDIKPLIKRIIPGGIKPDSGETERNPRARSARLRVAERL